MYGRGNGTSSVLGYDGASPLQDLSENLAATAADRDVDVTYNPADQIRTRTLDNDTYAWTQNQNIVQGYTPNSLNQYSAVGSVSPTYDARGNLLNFGTGACGYSSENLLTSVPGSVSLSYDPMGRLYQTTAGADTTRFAYDGNQLVAEYNASNQLRHRYVHGPRADEPLVWYEVTATTTARRWLHADERGSIVAISNSSGAAFAINRYDEHGVPATTNAERFQFTGQAWIAEAKLYYFKARFYAPTLGRFMQTDPIGYAAGMNLYAYVSGDPINLRDPSGLIAEVVVTGTRTPLGDQPSGLGLFFQSFIWPEFLTDGILADVGRALAAQKGTGVCDKPLPDGSTVRQNVRDINDVFERHLNNARFAGDDGSAAFFATLGYWFAKITPGGDWAQRLGEPGGNWNFGATGRSAGIPLNILLRGAGAAEMLESITGRTGSQSTGQGNPFGGPPYGDNPEGQSQIQEGYHAGCN